MELRNLSRQQTFKYVAVLLLAVGILYGVGLELKWPLPFATYSSCTYSPIDGPSTIIPHNTQFCDHGHLAKCNDGDIEEGPIWGANNMPCCAWSELPSEICYYSNTIANSRVQPYTLYWPKSFLGYSLTDSSAYVGAAKPYPCNTYITSGDTVCDKKSNTVLMCGTGKYSGNTFTATGQQCTTQKICTPYETRCSYAHGKTTYPSGTDTPFGVAIETCNPDGSSWYVSNSCVEGCANGVCITKEGISASTDCSDFNMVYSNYCRNNNIYGMNIYWTSGFYLNNGFKDWDCVPDIGNMLGHNTEVLIAQCGTCKEQDYYSLKAQCVNPTTTTTTTLSSTTTTTAPGNCIVRGCGSTCMNDCLAQGTSNLCSVTNSYVCLNACPTCGITTTTTAYKTCAQVGALLSSVFYDSPPSGYNCLNQYFPVAGKNCYYSCTQTTQISQPTTTTTLPSCDNKCKQLGYQWGTCSDQVISGSSLSIYGFCGQINCWCGNFGTTTQPTTSTTMVDWCGDGICTGVGNSGENKENCPDDCGAATPWYMDQTFIAGMLIVAVTSLGAAIYLKKKKQK